MTVIDAGDTRHVHVEFFIDAVKDDKATREQGRPIFKDVEMARLKFVGDNKKELVAPAHQKFMRMPGTQEWVTYAERYPRHYEAFKTGQALLGSGTPLAELPFLTEAKRSELKALNVHTAEALSSLDGSLLQKLGMYGRELKNQAQAYLDKAKETALETRLAGENAALKERIDALEAMIRGQGQPQVAVEMVPNTDVEVGSFDQLDDDELKRFIKVRTGQSPRGNPAHATLVRMAEEALKVAA